ncbi:hypothetical protein GPECTOR_71g564 [Gonium pectorale]|uniref:dolichyl-phosphate-mannose--protein mannosyltransferase n=1 Tax=Gonium pectorale TaxID=33097 RepID=A0A150G312_GONPE|nr:hypothetical protein GPECTOR_71g564 [Gonium pectorale]|eukprot:KXZ44203.1 hypothetical protein GPECTOR_71g564 [Gonium pectorale]
MQVHNGDVTNNGNTLWGLLQNDFWGQRISSPQSHKSYRPLTVLSFRLIRGAWSALPRHWQHAVMVRRARSLPPYFENEAGRRGLDPLPFHLANVLWHALVSGLVCRAPPSKATGVGGRGGVHGRLAGPARVVAWAVTDEPKFLRIVLLTGVGVAYVKLRSWVAVDQLVRIYRKVENPIPFSSSRLERVLTTGHLHSRYAGLLLAPLQLSADWSFSCIPLVGSLTDPRNGLTVALYGYLIWTVLAARPWGLLGTWWRAALDAAAASAGGAEAGSGGAATATEAEVAEAERLWGARWRLLVTASLLVGPFFPASNVLFYVGTFIGERLLYFPSIGFCILAAEALARGLLCAQRPRAASGAVKPAGNGAHDRASVAGKGKDGVGARRPTNAGVARLLYGFMAVVLLAYTIRTWRRNYDWWSEESLFESAAQAGRAGAGRDGVAGTVCASSAKVQLNLGILQRRRGDQRAALGHFRAARAIEPSYCDPGYWIGVSLINAGDPQAGLPELEAALACKYTANEALRALHALYGALHDADPSDPAPLPHALGEACDQLERAAAMYAQRGAAQDAMNALGWCLRTVRQRAEAAGAEGDAAGAAAQVAAEVFGTSAGPPPPRLLRCLEARTPLHRALAEAAGRPTAPRVRIESYRYMSILEEMPYCRTASATLARPSSEAAASATSSAASLAAPGAAAAAAGGSGATTPHMQLIHVVQSADAEDPWLQAEWGRALREAGRGKEGALHLSVSAMLLRQQLARAQNGQPPTVRSLADPSRPVGHKEALLAMAAALEEAAALGRPEEACELWGQAAEARRALAAAAKAAGATKDAAQQAASLARAMEELRRGGPACAEQLHGAQRLAEAAASGPAVGDGKGQAGRGAAPSGGGARGAAAAAAASQPAAARQPAKGRRH